MSLRQPPDHVGYLIGDVSRMLRTVYDRRVEPLGLTRAQWLVLARLSRIEGCTQTELAAQLEIKKPTLGKLLERLEEKMWVTRRGDVNDARSKRVFLTKRAGPVLDQMFSLADEVLDAAISGLNRKEAGQLNAALLQVKSNLSELLNLDDGPE
ncbi:MAG: transcriptional regulator [Rickettsiales bacterium]|nr:transcriptional regulator [Rickettsiales bacterium]